MSSHRFVLLSFCVLSCSSSLRALYPLPSSDAEAQRLCFDGPFSGAYAVEQGLTCCGFKQCQKLHLLVEGGHFSKARAQEEMAKHCEAAPPTLDSLDACHRSYQVAKGASSSGPPDPDYTIRAEKLCGSGTTVACAHLGQLFANDPQRSGDFLWLRCRSELEKIGPRSEACLQLASLESSYGWKRPAGAPSVADLIADQARHECKGGKSSACKEMLKYTVDLAVRNARREELLSELSGACERPDSEDACQLLLSLVAGTTREAPIRLARRNYRVRALGLDDPERLERECLKGRDESCHAYKCQDFDQDRYLKLVELCGKGSQSACICQAERQHETVRLEAVKRRFWVGDKTSQAFAPNKGATQSGLYELERKYAPPPPCSEEDAKRASEAGKLAGIAFKCASAPGPAPVDYELEDRKNAAIRKYLLEATVGWCSCAKK